MENKTIRISELKAYLIELGNQRDGNDEFELGYDACIEAIEGKFIGE